METDVLNSGDVPSKCCVDGPKIEQHQDEAMKKLLSAQACQILAELRKTGDLCDAAIKVNLVCAVLSCLKDRLVG